MQEAEEEDEDEDRLAAKDGKVINERTFYQKNREMLCTSADYSKLTPKQRFWWKDTRNIEEKCLPGKNLPKWKIRP